MPQCNRRAALGAMVCLLAIDATIAARADGPSGLYVGGNFAKSQFAFDTSTFENVLETEAANGLQTLTLPNSAGNARASAWWANVGYMCWSFAGIEASYLQLGELSFNAWGQLAPPPQTVIATTRLRSRGPALSLVVRVPLAEAFDLNLRVGEYLARTTIANNYVVDTTYVPSERTSNRTGLLAGVGLAYTVAEHWSAHLDYLRVNSAGADSLGGTYSVNVASVGISFTY